LTAIALSPKIVSGLVVETDILSSPIQTIKNQKQKTPFYYRKNLPD
jgi:hypothetical protein